jgi:hypothetical protein
MAGFQPTLYGRIWVTPEENIQMLPNLISRFCLRLSEWSVKLCTRRKADLILIQ